MKKMDNSKTKKDLKNEKIFEECRKEFLEKDLQVESSKVQSLLPNQKMHESVLDILAKGKEADPIGKLMEDMSQPNPKKIHSRALRKRAQELKSTQKGEEEMSSAYQSAWNTAKKIYLQEGREENMYQLAMKVKSAHPDWTVNQIADYLFMSFEDLNKILASYRTSQSN